MTNPGKHPLAEVFGLRVDDLSESAERHRRLRLCPFNNKVPNCTKDKANSPLGVCSIYHHVPNHEEPDVVITCPIRFRQDWTIAEQAASFFFDADATWTSLTEIRLTDRNGRAAGNIDLVLVRYDDQGKILDFGSLEIQAVYISGNVRKPFEYYMDDRQNRAFMDWSELADYYPRPDYLSSSRKRLVPQLLYKGGILQAWKKKQAVILQTSFFETLPALPETTPDQAEMAWFLYDLRPDQNGYSLVLNRVAYTEFQSALFEITTPQPGDIQDFMGALQNRLDQTLEGNPPDAPTLGQLSTLE